MRVAIGEEENITISRLMSGLNLKIIDKVELFPYKDLMTWFNFSSMWNSKFEKRTKS